MAQHNELGHKGEQQAVLYLLDKGYRILNRNYRYLKAEVDIIAIKDNVLIGVEVKTRSNVYFGNPQDFIDKKKIQLLVKAMNHYVESHKLNVEVRFDIVALIGKTSFKIMHIEDAFLYF
jgi:putative endonuclease